MAQAVFQPTDLLAFFHQFGKPGKKLREKPKASR
jgi:hypothetical protein